MRLSLEGLELNSDPGTRSQQSITWYASEVGTCGRRGDPGSHPVTGVSRAAVTRSQFSEATSQELRAASDAAGGGKAGSASIDWSKDYVYRGGLLLASQSASGGVRHFHTFGWVAAGRVVALRS